MIQDNQYIDAIKIVGSMLSHYDLEQEFPAFGFGAKFKSKGDTKACFPLTGRSGGSCVHGISVNFALGIYLTFKAVIIHSEMKQRVILQGVINAYRRIVPNLTFGGPSRLTPVILAALDIVKKTKLSQENQLYNVLMIITVSIHF